VTASCLYEGTIRHRRLAPRHEFRHRLALWYIDLDELPELLSGRLLKTSPGALRFRRRDYHGDPQVPLTEAVRDTVVEQTGSRPLGPIRLLTQVRSFGHCFNPVSFYFCLSSSTGDVQALLAEVTNTPWGERHAYVLSGSRDGSPLLVSSVDKAMHVSPFMPMDLSYTARASAPGETLSLQMESSRAGTRVFDATLSLTRRELTPESARNVAVRYPAASVRVLALIYARALRIKLAGAGMHPHPHGGRA
jgi:hypothetical protein